MCLSWQAGLKLHVSAATKIAIGIQRSLLGDQAGVFLNWFWGVLIVFFNFTIGRGALKQEKPCGITNRISSIRHAHRI